MVATDIRLRSTPTFTDLADLKGLSDEDLLLSLFFMPQVFADLKAAGPMPLDDPLRGSDLVELVRGVAAGSKVRSFSLVQPA